jgi:hypothetical protein
LRSTWSAWPTSRFSQLRDCDYPPGHSSISETATSRNPTTRLEEYPDRFHRGFVLHCGDHARRCEDDLWSFPISLLWSIGESIAWSPPLTFEQRLRAAEQRFLAGLASPAMVTSRRDALELSLAPIEAILDTLVQAFGNMGLAAEVSVDSRERSTQAARPTDMTWSGTWRVGFPDRAGELGSIEINGTQFGVEDVAWAVRVLPEALASDVGLDPQTTRVAWDGDHIAALTDLLAPVADRVDSIARWLEGR